MESVCSGVHRYLYPEKGLQPSFYVLYTAQESPSGGKDSQDCAFVYESMFPLVPGTRIWDDLEVAKKLSGHEQGQGYVVERRMPGSWPS